MRLAEGLTFEMRQGRVRGQVRGKGGVTQVGGNGRGGKELEKVVRVR